MIAGKVWGTTELLLSTPFIEIHRIIVKPNSRCSMHKHNFKHNCFMVTRGLLNIEVRKNDYDLVDVTKVLTGGSTTVPPREFHRFVCGVEGATAYEVYYPEALGPDIEREDCGTAPPEPLPLIGEDWTAVRFENDVLDTDELPPKGMTAENWAAWKAGL